MKTKLFILMAVCLSCFGRVMLGLEETKGLE